MSSSRDIDPFSLPVGQGRAMMVSMTAAIHLCRAYDARAGAETQGARLLVDRLWPRGIAKADLPIDAWLKEATPSPDLRTWFGHDPAKWTQFSALYRAELAQDPSALLRALDWCLKGPVTLLYGAKDTKHTHALILRDVLQETLSHAAPVQITRP